MRYTVLMQIFTTKMTRAIREDIWTNTAVVGIVETSTFRRLPELHSLYALTHLRTRHDSIMLTVSIETVTTISE